MSDHSTPDVAAAMGQLQLGEPSAPPPPPPPPPPPTPRPATALPSQLSSISSFTNVGFGVVSENRTDERKRAVLAQAANVSVADYHLKALKSSDRLLDPSDPRIKEDIIRLLSQYLTDEGFHVSKLTLQDESNVRIHEAADRHLDLRRLRKVILEGDWAEVDKLVLGSTQRVTALLGRQYKPFLYAVYKQQFLESIEHREVHKAFTFLQKRLKPLEAYQANADEFRDLCYLLTATSVHDVPAFRQWEGVGPGRERLAEQLQAMIDLESVDRDVYVPPNRLLTLLKQAVAYQVVYSRYHPKVPPRVHTLLEDYTALIVPNTTRHLLQGHSDNVKCIAFVGAAGHLIASGSSDNTVRLWRSETGAAAALLTGHSSRIWDVASDLAGSTLASAASDGTVRLWDVRKATMMVEQGGGAGDTDGFAADDHVALLGGGMSLPTLNASAVLTGHSGDVYATAFHPTGSYIASGGYDRSVRVADTATGATIKVFAGQPSATTGIGAANGMSGHALAVTSLAFTPMGNLCVSGSKDNTLRFFDLVSGLCVRTLASHLGEVTAVGVSPSGTYLVTASKDNANRIWDLRMLPRPVRRLKGHTNTAKNFVRAAFAGGGDGALVVGGSEDGRGYCWDRESGAVVQTLSGHRGIVYDVKWNAHQQLMASCSDDHTVRTWAFDESQPMGERDLPARPSSS